MTTHFWDPQSLVPRRRGHDCPTGIDFTCVGYYTCGALGVGATGTEYTALGFYALASITTGSYDTAIGAGAMWHETTGSNDVAVGGDAMRNTVGVSSGVAMGRYSNAAGSGSGNTSIGTNSFQGQSPFATFVSNSTGVDNTDVGLDVMAAWDMTTASYNTAIGGLALAVEATGTYNVAAGFSAQEWLRTPSSNVAVGAYAMQGVGGDLTGSLTSGSATITVTGTFPANIANGDSLADYQQAIPLATTVLSFNSGAGTITMSAHATANATTEDVKWTNAATGSDNTAVGSNVLGPITTASNNVGDGHDALSSATTVLDAVAIGYFSQAYNITANYNTSVGFQTLQGGSATAPTGQYNSVFGLNAMSSSSWTTANANSIFGAAAGAAITTGSNNAGFGYHSLVVTTTGAGNSAFGYSALVGNIGGSSNTALGAYAGQGNTTGSNGTFIGYEVGPTCSTGNGVILIGTSSGIDCPLSSTANYLNIQGVITATGTNTPSTSVATMPGTLNVTTSYQANGTAGVSCTGTPTSSFASVNGIVTHC